MREPPRPLFVVVIQGNLEPVPHKVQVPLDGLGTDLKLPADTTASDIPALLEKDKDPSHPLQRGSGRAVQKSSLAASLRPSSSSCLT